MKRNTSEELGRSIPEPRRRPKQHVQELSVLEVITIPTAGSDGPSESTREVELKTVRFGYFDPDANEVFVAGSFNNWDPRGTPMRPEQAGEWSAEVRLPPGEYPYRFLVDGEWRDDPSAQFVVMNKYGSFDAVLIV